MIEIMGQYLNSVT